MGAWIAKIRRRKEDVYLNWNALRLYVLQRDGYRCRKCGRTKADGVKRLEVNHVVPASRGGATVASNLMTLCDSCHARQPFHNHMRRR